MWADVCMPCVHAYLVCVHALCAIPTRSCQDTWLLTFPPSWWLPARTLPGGPLAGQAHSPCRCAERRSRVQPPAQVCRCQKGRAGGSEASHCYAGPCGLGPDFLDPSFLFSCLAFLSPAFFSTRGPCGSVVSPRPILPVWST